jgi:Na+-translocating ferredoxin:NAD+ oxidoreductase RNF subunit RnfB
MRHTGSGKAVVKFGVKGASGMCTDCVAACRFDAMAVSAKRINVTLDDEHAGKLARLAERTHVQEGTLARSLLSTALDDADPDASRITEKARHSTNGPE